MCGVKKAVGGPNKPHDAHDAGSWGAAGALKWVINPNQTLKQQTMGSISGSRKPALAASALPRLTPENCAFCLMWLDISIIFMAAMLSYGPKHGQHAQGTISSAIYDGSCCLFGLLWSQCNPNCVPIVLMMFLYAARARAAYRNIISTIGTQFRLYGDQRRPKTTKTIINSAGDGSWSMLTMLWPVCTLSRSLEATFKHT